MIEGCPLIDFSYSQGLENFNRIYDKAIRLIVTTLYKNYTATQGVPFWA